MTAESIGLREQLVKARQALDVAFSTWSAMDQPESVTLRERINFGYDWLETHRTAKEQERGKTLIGQLRAQAWAAEEEEKVSGEKRNRRRAYDAAEWRFRDAEAEYMRLLGEAHAQGIDDAE